MVLEEGFGGQKFAFLPETPPKAQTAGDEVVTSKKTKRKKFWNG